MTRTGGRGTPADLELVLNELTLWPAPTLATMESQGTKVVVCRNSVVDYRIDLRGKGPRGWPPGAVWDTVPGSFLPDRNEVVIAVIGHAAGSPHVPRTGEGHGSRNLVVHESGHALDLAAATHRSTGAEFVQARNKDLATLSVYERQPDPAGPQETWAESAARFYGKDPNDLTAHPNLHAFWLGNTIAAIGVALDELRKAIEKLQATPPPPVIGSATMTDDRSIVLDLVATDAKGAIGDAQLTYTPSHALYSTLLQRLSGLRRDNPVPVPAWDDPYLVS